MISIIISKKGDFKCSMPPWNSTRPQYIQRGPSATRPQHCFRFFLAFRYLLNIISVMYFLYFFLFFFWCEIKLHLFFRHWNKVLHLKSWIILRMFAEHYGPRQYHSTKFHYTANSSCSHMWQDSNDVVTLLSPISGTSGRLQSRVSVSPWFLHSDCVMGT